MASSKTIFKIKSNNFHLLDIYNSNYYVELGNLSLDTITQIFNYKEVKIERVYDHNITLNGTGQLSKSADDIVNQLNCLNTINKENCNNVIFITFGVCRYVDELKMERFAPIFLLPVIFDNSNSTIKIIGSMFPNNVLLTRLQNLSIINQTIEKRIEYFSNIPVITDFMIESLLINFKRFTGLEISLNSFLTPIAVQYKETSFKVNSFQNNTQLSEFVDEEIINNFYADIHFITPLNIKQKFACIKAHNGENTLIIGSYGSGKTTAALNICADAYVNNRSVLYVNNSIKDLSKFKSLICQYGLGEVTRSLVNNLDTTEEMLNFKEEETPLYDASLDKVMDMLNIFNRTISGCPYKYVLEKLAIYKYHELKGKLVIENDLERFEIEQVCRTLEIVEENLQHITSISKNPWKNLISNEAITNPQDILNKTLKFDRINNDTYEYVKELYKKYKFDNKYTYQDISKISDALLGFNTLDITDSWFNDDFIFIAETLLQKLDDLIKRNNELNEFIETKVISQFRLNNVIDSLNAVEDYLHENSSSLTTINIDLPHYSELLNSVITNSSNLKVLYHYFSKLFGTSSLNVRSLKAIDATINFFVDNNININYVKDVVITEDTINALKDEFNNYVCYRKEINDILHADNLSLDDILLFTKKSTLNRYVNRHNLNVTKDRFSDIILRVSFLKGICDSIYNTIGLTNTAISESVIELYHNIFTFVYESKSEYIYTFLKSTEKTTFSYQAFYKATSNYKNTIISFEKNVQKLYELGLIKEYDKYKNIIDLYSNIDNIIQLQKNVDNIITIFINKKDITANDLKVLLSYNGNRNYISNNLAKIEKQLKEYFMMYYKGLDTKTKDIYTILDYFKYLLNCSTDYDKLKGLLVDNTPKIIYDLGSKIRDYAENWNRSFREFASLFVIPLTYAQDFEFNKIRELMKKYVSSIDDVEYVFNINQALDVVTTYRLPSVVEDILEEKITKNIRDEYLYATLIRMYNQEMERNPFKFDIDELNASIEELQKYEHVTANNNVLKLQEKIYEDIKKEDKKITEKVVNFFTQSVPPGIYLVDTFYLNTIKNVSLFDMVIVDNACLENANAYQAILKANQLVIMGDNLKRSVFSNSLLHRLSKVREIEFTKNYYDGILPKYNNYEFIPQKRVLEFVKKYNSFDEFIIFIVNKYELTKQSATIFVDTIELYTRAYKLIVNELSKVHDVNEITKLLNDTICLINTTDSAYDIKDCTYIWCNYELSLDPDLFDYYINNTRIGKTICYGTDNIDVISKLSLVYIPEHKVEIVESVVDALRCDFSTAGYVVKDGMGLIDLFIYTNNKTCGIIIYGKRAQNCFSVIDDYLYYQKLYQEKGIDILAFSVDQLFLHYEKSKNKVFATLKD